MRTGFALVVALYGPDFGVFLVEGRGDGADFGKGSSCENDSLGAAFCDGRAGIGDIETVSGAGGVVKGLAF